MRAARKVQALRQIAVVRAMQRRVGEIASERAGAALRQADARHAESLAVLTQDEARWAQELGAATMPLETTQAWGRRILTSAAEVDQLRDRARSADEEAGRRRTAAALAIAGSEVADDLAAAAARKLAQVKDEARLNGVAELIGVRGRTA